MKTLLAIRHVHFEDLGGFAGPLEDAGYVTRYVEAAGNKLAALDPLSADLVVVLGGPLGVCDAGVYPVIGEELRFLRTRLAADRPTLGICLGAQLMAKALGADIHPGATREIGWAPVNLTPEGLDSPIVALDSTPVLHWHGDNFELPDGCVRLAATEGCPTQAFAKGPNILALQFHAEAVATTLEHWLIGHAVELAGAARDPNALRAAARTHGPTLRIRADAMVREWLSGLVPPGGQPAHRLTA